MMRFAKNHVEAAILRAVVAEATAACPAGNAPAMIVEAIDSSDWASATFVGATHELTIRLEGSAPSVSACVARIVENLPEREIPVAGRIVAELAVTGGAQHNMSNNDISILLTVNVLTIMD